jgi:hypothetical protein
MATQITTCATAADPTPMILPAMRWEARIVLIKTSAMRLVFSSRTLRITATPYSVVMM